MPDDIVAVAPEVESQPVEEPVEAPAAEATQPEEDAATLKKRLAGKDQALTRIQQERDAAKARLAELEAAEQARKEAEMTELERANARLAEAERKAAEAEAKALRVELTAKYPNAIEALGGELLSEEKLEALESRLTAAATPAAEAEEEPRVLATRPRASTTPPEPVSRVADLKARIAATPKEVFDEFMGRA